MENNGFVTISVKESTRERLKTIGKFGESWDDLLKRVIDSYEEKKIEKISKG